MISDEEWSAIHTAIQELPSFSLTQRTVVAQKCGPVVVEDFTNNPFTLRNHKLFMEAVLDTQGNPVIRYTREESIRNPNHTLEMRAWEEKHPIMQKLNGISQQNSD